MKIILTRQNDDGSFDEVGMNNRVIVTIRPSRRADALIARHAAVFGRGKPVRAEYYHNTPLDHPFRMIVLNKLPTEGK